MLWYTMLCYDYYAMIAILYYYEKKQTHDDAVNIMLQSMRTNISIQNMFQGWICMHQELCRTVYYPIAKGGEEVSGVSIWVSQEGEGDAEVERDRDREGEFVAVSQFGVANWELLIMIIIW